MTNPYRPRRSGPETGREAMFNVPSVIVGLIAAFVLIHLGRTLLPLEMDFRILFELAFIPARVGLFLDPAGFGEALQRSLVDLPPEAAAVRAALGQLVQSEAGLRPWTVLTYAVLHGSWMHLLLNSAWLLAFGSPVARRFGSVRFLLLFGVCAAAGAGAHLIGHLADPVPMIGASGGISGCMAAAIRFVFRTGGQPIVMGVEPSAVDRLPAQSLLDALADRRVLLFVVVWFGTNLVFGLVSGPLGITDAAVAWQAHVGGFLAGLLLFPLFDPVPALRRF